jgi:hypothetical protein
MSFGKINKIILMFIWKGKETRIPKTILERNEVGGATEADFKIINLQPSKLYAISGGKTHGSIGHAGNI